MPGISTSKIAIPFNSGGIDYLHYWTTLISATVETAAPTHVVLTFPTAQTSLVAADFTIAGFTISSASWTGAVLTLVLSTAVLVFDEDLTITFVKTGDTGTVTNNVADDGNTQVWLNYKDDTTITKSAANLVSLWEDKLASGNDVAQAGADNLKPIYDILRGVKFDGVRQFLKSGAIAALDQPTSVYLVVKQKSYGLFDTLIDGNADGSGYIYQNTTYLYLTSNGATNSINRPNPSFDTWNIIRGQFNGGNSRFVINDNDAATGNAGAGNMGGVTLAWSNLANSYFGNVQFKEAIFRDVADDSATDTAINNYLKRKYFPVANVIAISGQSNAIGYFPEDVLPAGYEGDQDNIFIRFVPLTGAEFDKMNPAVNCGYDIIADPDDNTGWSAEQSASHDLLTGIGADVMVVKSGYNGGAIAQWDAGLAPYTELEAGLIAALDHPSYKSFDKLSLLWMQGETDAINSQTTVYYEARMRSIISRLRASDDRLVGLQVVMVKLPDIMSGSGLDATKRGNINTAFTNIIADTSNTVLLDPDTVVGVEMRADNLHYTAASLLLIGSAWKVLMP